MGIWDDIGDVVGDVIEAPGDVIEGIGDVASSLFEGPGQLIGLVAAGAALFVVGPGAIIPAFVAGSAAGNSLIRHRHMTDQERAFADRVFGGTLPPNDRIVLTNLTGLEGRKFVCPNVSGQCLVNLGPAYDDPMGYSDDSYRSPGKVFIHELTHVWQIHHATFAPGLVCEGIFNQVSSAPYDPGRGGRPWGEYNLEQQATIVDEWFAPQRWMVTGPLSMGHPFYRYICEDILGQPLRRTRMATASLARVPNSMELWWPGPAGSMEAAYWYEGGQWQRYNLGGPVSAAGRLSAVARMPGAMELWWPGPHDTLEAAYWYEGSQWQRYNLGGPASANGGVAAVCRIPRSMELWWPGSQGSLEAAYWYEGGQWQRYNLGGPGTASPTGGVAAVSRIPNSMELWWPGPQGSLEAAYWYEGGQWQRYNLGGPGTVRPNGRITAVSRQPNSMELWWPGPEGSLEAAYWYEGGQWQRYNLGGPGTVA